MAFWMWVTILIIITLIIYFFGKKNHDYFSKRKVPYLKASPYIGNMGPIVFKKLPFSEFLLKMYNDLKGHPYGGIFEFMNPTLLLRDPELIKKVTVKDFEFFLDHRQAMNGKVEPLFGKGLFSLNGHRWKEMRSTLSPAFTSSKMKNMFVLVTECGKQLGEFLKECNKDKNMKIEGLNIEREGNLLVVEMKELFTRFTNDVIATSAFGISCDSLKNPKNEFFEMGRSISTIAGVRRFIMFGYILFPRLMEALDINILPRAVSNFFRFLVQDSIQTRESRGIIRPDMIHLLMQAKNGTLKSEENTKMDGNSIPKPKWDADDLTAQAFLFFVAGFETASTLLSFISHLLAVYPDIQNKLQDEIDQSLTDNDGKFTYESIHNMKYLDMVVSETLRLYPPAVVTDRKCVKEYNLPSEPPITLKPGDLLWLPIFALHRDPEYFPNPEKFDPERFSEENKNNIRPYTYIPFGAGPRNCIGNRFALMETKIALVHLLSSFNLKVVSKTPIPLKLTKNSFSMNVDGGFWIGLEERILT